MPLYSYSCPRGHTADLLRKHAEADAPADCACGLALTRALSATAPIVVAGAKGAREGVADDLGRRSRASSTGFSLADWKCPACAATWLGVYKGDAPDSEPCPSCATAGVRDIGIPDVDWFTKEHGANGGYYDRGLGRWVTSLAHRRQIMDEMGLVEFGDVGDVHDDYQRRMSEKATREDAEVREMLRGFEHGPDAAALKTARDRGDVKDWSWAVDQVGGLDRE